MLSGTESKVLEQDLNRTPMCQKSVDATQPLTGGELHDCEHTLNLPLDKTHLNDGESLCVIMSATAGGYYDLQNYNKVYNSTATFPQTSNSKRVCFIFDGTKPAHCLSTGGSCTSQPLTLSTRLSRSTQVKVTVEGWSDPNTTTGSASGLAKFRLEVHGMDTGKDSLTMQHAQIQNLSQEWNPNNPTGGGGPYERTVLLPDEDKARLYSILLEVHDRAGNVAYARRLVLKDNSSSVQLHDSASLTVTHADPRSSRRWQIEVSWPLCVNWTGRFYNTDLYHNNLLMPVTPADGSLGITGHLDQTSGVLPTRGTVNVAGVTKFEVSTALV
ncbi:hypothetical protein ACOMHN_032768 [Nucella lapillus]